MKKILLIDNDEILVDLYKTKFSQEGFNIIAALDDEQGIKLAKEEKPDLIILDILLPKGNGISVLKKIREDAEISSIIVIALSNFDDPKARKEAFELGAKDYLLKTNFTPDELVKKIEEYLK